MGAAWIVNQAIGFGVLYYPHDLKTIAWGLAIGVGALAATAAATLALRALSRTSQLSSLCAALVAAYAGYELVLFAVTPALGGSGAFTFAIIARLSLLNVAWLAGLLAVCQGSFNTRSYRAAPIDGQQNGPLSAQISPAKRA